MVLSAIICLIYAQRLQLPNPCHSQLPHPYLNTAHPNCLYYTFSAEIQGGHTESDTAERLNNNNTLSNTVMLEFTLTEEMGEACQRRQHSCMPQIVTEKREEQVFQNEGRPFTKHGSIKMPGNWEK